MEIADLRTLNQRNVSEDSLLTKERVKRLLDSASDDDKTAILLYSGDSSLRNFNLILAKGYISVGQVLVLSQVFKVDPFWIIGAPGCGIDGFTDHLSNDTKSFLDHTGYGKFNTKCIIISKDFKRTFSKWKLIKLLFKQKKIITLSKLFELLGL